MKLVLWLILGWDFDCGWIEKNPCVRTKLPRITGGGKIPRTVLTVEQVKLIAAKLDEPYSTLVLFPDATGVRIGEAIALSWNDFSAGQLHIVRRIADGEVDEPKSNRSNRHLPIDPGLMARVEALGRDGEYVFRSRNGGPLNPGNARKRYLHPACKELGIVVGGWHDFRHTLATTLRRNNVHPKVVSATLGQERVTFAAEVYDHASVEDMRGPLAAVAAHLLPSMSNSAGAKS